MHLTPREQERLTIFTVAELARRRRGRGRRLNAPEAIALICDEVIEAAWDGAGLDEVIAAGRSVLGPDDVLDGVPGLVPHIQVEAMFPNGTALVAIDDPIPAQDGVDTPGAVRTRGEPIEINAGRAHRELSVRNTGDTTVYVSSHFPLAEVNDVLELDRDAARGMRLDIPAGTALAFPPGEERGVRLVTAGPQEAAR